MSDIEDSSFNLSKNNKFALTNSIVSATSTPLQSPNDHDPAIALSQTNQFRPTPLDSSDISNQEMPTNKGLNSPVFPYMFNLFSKKSTRVHSSPRPQGLIMVNEHSPGGKAKMSETSEIELPKVEEFSFSSILDSVKQEGDATLGSVFKVLDFYRGDLTMELRNAQALQHTVISQMSALDRLALSSLSTVQSRVSQANENVHNLKGVDQLADAAEKAYHSIAKIKQTLLEIEALLPPHERLGPSFSAHKRHYPKLHGILKEDLMSNIDNMVSDLDESEDVVLPYKLSNHPNSRAMSIRSRSTSTSSISSIKIPSASSIPPPPLDYPLNDNRLKRSIPSKGYPRVMMGLRSGVPSTAVVRSTSVSNLNAVYSDRQYPTSMITSSSAMMARALPVHEADSTSTISRQSIRTFSIRSYVSLWGGKANSGIEEEAPVIVESAEEKLRKLMGMK